MFFYEALNTHTSVYIASFPCAIIWQKRSLVVLQWWQSQSAAPVRYFLWKIMASIRIWVVAVQIRHLKIQLWTAPTASTAPIALHRNIFHGLSFYYSPKLWNYKIWFYKICENCLPKCVWVLKLFFLFFLKAQCWKHCTKLITKLRAFSKADDGVSRQNVLWQWINSSRALRCGLCSTYRSISVTERCTFREKICARANLWWILRLNPSPHRTQSVVVSHLEGSFCQNFFLLLFFSAPCISLSFSSVYFFLAVFAIYH